MLGSFDIDFPMPSYTELSLDASDSYALRPLLEPESAPFPIFASLSDFFSFTDSFARS